MFRAGWRRLGWALVWIGLTGAGVAGAAEKTEEAVRLFEARRQAEARPLLEAAAREDPSDSRAAFYLGRLFLTEGDSDRAVEWIEKAVSLDAGRAEYHLWLARACGAKALAASVLKKGPLARRVKREFERASALDPDNLEARFGLIEFYLRAPGVLGGSVPRAREQAAQVGKRDPLQGHRAAGRIAEYEKRFDTALEEYSAAVREFPGETEPIYWLGSFFERRGDFARAFDTYEKLLEREPEELADCYRIGKVAAPSGDQLERGVECLKRYLARTPGPGEPSLRAGAGSAHSGAPAGGSAKGPRPPA
jgi:tetratricopeptide (TPR) repeat protein